MGFELGGDDDVLHRFVDEGTGGLSETATGAQLTDEGDVQFVPTEDELLVVSKRSLRRYRYGAGNTVLVGSADFGPAFAPTMAARFGRCAFVAMNDARADESTVCGFDLGDSVTPLPCRERSSRVLSANEALWLGHLELVQDGEEPSTWALGNSRLTALHPLDGNDLVEVGEIRLPPTYTAQGSASGGALPWVTSNITGLQLVARYDVAERRAYLEMFSTSGVRIHGGSRDVLVAHPAGLAETHLFDLEPSANGP